MHYLAFDKKPSSGQFAKDGVWESAWSFEIDALPPQDKISAYTHSTSELAFEAFFGDHFFGIRAKGDAEKIHEFAIECVAALDDTLSGKQFFDSLQNRLKLNLFASPMSYAEIGAVNAWRSVGGFKIHNLPVNKTEFDQLFITLQQSNVASNKSHSKAVEFAFDSPMSHWLAIPISDQSVNRVISQSLLNDALLLGRQFILGNANNSGGLSVISQE
jgi:hypothetical protein